MRRKTGMVVCISLVFLSSFTAMAFSADWAGVDETVVEKFAEEAGRSPRAPYINTDQGDLLLFVFLLAGAVGGFIGGYYFRFLFHEKKLAAANG